MNELAMQASSGKPQPRESHVHVDFFFVVNVYISAE